MVFQAKKSHRTGMSSESVKNLKAPGAAFETNSNTKNFGFPSAASEDGIDFNGFGAAAEGASDLNGLGAAYGTVGKVKKESAQHRSIQHKSARKWRW